MRKVLTILLLYMLAVPVSSKDRWPDGSVMKKWFRSVPKPAKGRQFLITDYGAFNDSTKLQTAAIQKAIDAAAVKGGTVVIPEGTWLSGALYFKPKTHLYLEKGAVLKGSVDIENFPDVPVHIEGVLQPFASALINADRCNGFSVRGEGTLDGNGYPYWVEFWTGLEENPSLTNLEVKRPRMMGISNSSNVTIEGVELRNSAFWNIHLYKCKRVYISGVNIHAPIEPLKAPCSDGIDLDACRDVHIVSCTIATGDDHIAVKGGKGPWADKDPDNGTNANILVEDCSFGHGPGVLVFGSECIGAKNVILRNSKVTDAEKLLWLKMRPDTPQKYSDILIEGVKGDVWNIVYVKPWKQYFDLKDRKDIPMSFAENIDIQKCTLKCRRRRNIEEAPEQFAISGLNLRDNKLNWKYNKDEDKVKPYTLPDPLIFPDSTKVETAAQWEKRRSDILELFQSQMYGTMPPAIPVYLETTEENTPQEDYAIRRRVRMTFREDGSGPHIDWLVLYPVHAKEPSPAVISLNYYGNDSIYTQKRFPVPMKDILSRGYTYVTACYEDISPDPEDLQDPSEQLRIARTNMYELWDPDCTTGSLMAWAWALCRGMDMLEKDPAIDASRVLLTGSSRLGKAALLAGAFDRRFAVVALNQTGGGGVPLSKRNFGEYVSSEVEHFGYWWCSEFAKYAEKERKTMPFDQHMLLACIAPRPLLVEGFNNPWFDARGEFLALKAASPVWALLGADGLPDVEFPHSFETQAIGTTVGYVKRKGDHGIMDIDWTWMLDFSDKWFLAAGTRTEALEDSAWEKSAWISAANAPVVTGKVNSKQNYRAADGASWFLSTVKNPQKVVKAVWMTTALGVYEIYVNGKPVGEDALKPGYTHPVKTRISYTYDITDAFNKAAQAENVLSAQVTPGWWADKIVTPNGHEGMVGRKPAFRAVLQLTYADGSTSLHGTGTRQWTAGIAGPVTHAGIFDGEVYDARILPGYVTPEKLSAPEENTEFSAEIVPTAGAEICYRKDLTLKPIEAYAYKDIEGATDSEFGTVVKRREYAPGETITLREGETLVVDFGQNAAAVPAFRFKAAEGTVLTCLPGEILNDGNGAKSRGMDAPEGSVHRTNLRLKDRCFSLEYTFGPGKGWASYMPLHTFFGYRYLSITASADVTFGAILSVPVTSITKEMETGTITTGNADINKLISNTVWGQRSNYLSVPTDCPQRNERLGWTADTQVFAETGSFFADIDAFFHKWMRDIRDSQAPSGGIPGVAPFGQFGSETKHMMRHGWSDAGIIVPWIVWKQFGDTAIIEENWDSMVKFIGHVHETRYDYDTNIEENGNYQWADWLSYEPLESNSNRGLSAKDANGKRHPLPETKAYWNYLGACYWSLDAEMMRDMAAATGRESVEFEAMASEAKEYIRQNFIGPDGLFKTDILNTMQTPALFALRTGVVEGEARDAMISRLRENFAAHDGCLQTGFLGTSILMQTLTENGMADIAWDLLFQRKNPSWLYSVDNGASTIWERWNSYTRESGMGPKGMNSFNHYAYGCVCQWIWETAAGIAADPAQPGFKHIIMKPVPDKRLGSIDAVYHSAAGTIRSAWKYEGDVCTWNFTIPDGAEASVTLPGKKETRTYGPGSYSLTI